MSQEHLIHRLNIDIYGLKTNQEYQRLANRLSAIVRSSLTSKLDRLLEQLDFKGYHIIIDYLEIDLGLININNLDNNIISKIEKQLNKVIPSLRLQLLYKINQGEFDLLSSDEISIGGIKNLIQEKFRSFPGPIKADIDFTISTSHKALDAKVIPANAKFLDAVIHYLEFGYFSRKLYVSDEIFAKVFTSTVLEYQKEIANYFGRKSEEKKITALERFQKQLSSSFIVKTNSFEAKKKTEKLFDKLYHDKVQTLAKTIQSIDLEKGYSQSSKKELLGYVGELYASKKSITKITDIFKEADKKLAKKIEEKSPKAISKKSKKKELDQTLLPGDQAVLDFKQKLKTLLDEKDRGAFNKFLKNPFVLSLNKSYVSTIDSMEVLSKAFLHLLAHPDHRNNIFASLPSYIESEADLITQMYKKSPAVLGTLLQQSALDGKGLTFLNKLPKKHLNLVMQSMISYYSKLAPILNYVNEINSELKLPSFGGKLSEVKHTHIAQISLLSAIIESPKNTKVIVDDFVAKAFQEIESTISLKQSSSQQTKQTFSAKTIRNKFEQFAKTQSLIKTRTYNSREKILQLSVHNVVNESTPYQEDPAALSVFQLKTLLSQYYIPFVVNQEEIVIYNIDSLIKNLVKHQKNKAKAPINKLFEAKKILKNTALRRLSYANFKSLLSLALPTEAQRKFIRLFEKYSFIWKNTIDQAEAQLIFLSLVENYNEIDEATIFKHYFNKLKLFKAWTYDVQRKKIVDNYELHREKLQEEVRMVIINYIDDIPTLESMAFKESRKKLEAGIPVKNAGLVLLWPFFKTLFNLCDYLTKDGDFIDSIRRERAVLLLQYMAVKSSTIEEPYLALNKILTGFPLDESIASEIILTDKEKDIADALLMNVIRQWPSFQNSSPDNLRGSFLIRDGILYFKGGQWVLQVENKSYDLLLGKLPWGFSLIRLSWLTYMVKVEWN